MINQIFRDVKEFEISMDEFIRIYSYFDFKNFRCLIRNFNLVEFDKFGKFDTFGQIRMPNQSNSTVKTGSN